MISWSMVIYPFQNPNQTFSLSEAGAALESMVCGEQMGKITLFIDYLSDSWGAGIDRTTARSKTPFLRNAACCIGVKYYNSPLGAIY